MAGGNIQQMRTVITADEKDFVRGIARASKATTQISTRMRNMASAGRQGQLAFIELGRGLSDLQFGFHGAANNAQRMTEIFAQLAIAAKAEARTHLRC